MDDDVLQACYRYALSLVHDRGEARGLVHEAWMRASQRYPDLNQAILIRTIRNLFVDTTRRARLVVLEGDRLRRAFSDARTDMLVEQGEMAAALATLNPEEREVLYLSIVEGYTAEEIGLLTEKPRNTVLSQLRRGKEKLRERVTAPTLDEALDEVEP
jgi:RNA polymerase sigma-70 factor, ECF subfamily